MCFLFYFMYSTVHIFDICQEAAPASVRKQSTTLFLTLFAVIPPRTVCPSSTSSRPVTVKVFKIITISRANKIVQNNAGLNNDDCKFRTDIKRLLENSTFIAQNSKSAFHIHSIHICTIFFFF